MRKTQKTQIENFLHLLSRAHEEIKKAIASNKKDTALDLLSQCQDGAIQIGETIENLEGENFTTIPLLENYCEVLYQIYENICSNQSINPNKSYKALQKSLNPIKNSVKNEIKVQIEAVFLPYKASMWDSLESIWQAADEDPDCDAYVIPIPYYDKNPDGSFKEMHYEGDLYPDYVPITDYQAYDFQERCPDMIFIHNPYDECNYVTSVHPFFYSKNLKQFTEKLVYVPYFVLDEIDPENQSAIEGMKHFCTVPGVIYADKVIVQSEDMRQIYVNVLTEYAKGSQANRKYWEDKILGLGSPKIDKVLSTRKEDIEIPEEWRRVIEKADGSFKKVIFYNTSVTAFLEHEEQYLKKMEDVFKVFKEAKEEIALLWRPHPLMKATIESMRPELWEEYQGLVAEYKKKGWGIYDDTADLDRAIAVCDGYYGDPSSVVKLCQEAGCETILQTFKSEGNENKIRFSACAYVDKKLYFWDVYLKALIYFDLLIQETIYITVFDDVVKDISNFDWMYYDSGRLFMTDMQGKYVLEFNIYTNMYKIFQIDCNIEIYENIAMISYFNNKLFVIPRLVNHVIEIDLDDDSIIKNNNIYQEIERHKFNSPFFSWGISKKNDLWLIGESGNYICKYNMESHFIKTIFLKNLSQKCKHAIVYDKNIYLLGDYGKIFKWTIGNDMVVTEMFDLKSKKNEYGRIITNERKMIILPFYGTKILVFDMINKTLEIYKDYPKTFFYANDESPKYTNYAETENVYFFAMQSANYLLIVEKKSLKLSWMDIAMPSLNDTIRFLKKNNRVIQDRSMELEDVISYVMTVHKSKKDIVTETGNKIWISMK